MATTPADSPQGVLHEARRLLNERGWNPLAGAVDANGGECSPSDPTLSATTLSARCTRVIWPNERLLTGKTPTRSYRPTTSCGS